MTSSRVPVRTGIGIDVHAFDENGTNVLVIAGLEWPGYPPLSGHSDGDVVLHAITDSLLSAIGQGDLGTHFGVDRPEFRDADSRVFLEHTLQLVGDSGYAVGSVAVQLVAAKPKILERREQAQALLSELVGASVSFTATTTDGLGFIGAEQGAAAIATSVVYER